MDIFTIPTNYREIWIINKTAKHLGIQTKANIRCSSDGRSLGIDGGEIIPRKLAKADEDRREFIV